MYASRKAFSLVELSIVLVILGLLTGGILAGQSLIRAAELRSQMSQINEYRVAVNTFRDKYFGLPGDLPANPANNLGFKTRGAFAGQGDGDGIIESVDCNSASGCEKQISGGAGEAVVFWSDLQRAGLISGDFSAAPVTAPGAFTNDQLLPKGKINSHYVYVWSRAQQSFFGVSSVTAIGDTVYSSATMPVGDAFRMDTKTDDGLPNTGSIKAEYQNASISWTTGYPYANAGGYIAAGAYPAVAASATTCFDNGNVNNATYSYSVSNESGQNCALSFSMNGR